MLTRSLPSSSFPKRRKRERSGIERAPQRIWPRHRRWVKSHECCVPNCPTPYAVDFAHIRTAANSGTALKPFDWFSAPLCHNHHAEQHQVGARTFEDRHKIDLDRIAAELVRTSPDRKMRLAMLELSLDTPADPLPVMAKQALVSQGLPSTIPVYRPPTPSEDTPHVPDPDTRRRTQDQRVAHTRHERPARPALPHPGQGANVVAEREREGLHRHAQDRRPGDPAEVEGGAGRGAAADLQHPELAHLGQRHRPAPLPVEPGDLSPLLAHVVTELRAASDRPIARFYVGPAGSAQALAMWRGLMIPAKALGFIQITRLGRKVLARAGDPPPIPRKSIEIYEPVATVMARVA